MQNLKPYEILNGLPAYGPMYVPIGEGYENPFSEGFVVRFFKSDGTSWVANFAVGWTNTSFIKYFQESGLVIVLSKGQGYIISPESTIPLNTFGIDINWMQEINEELIAFTNNLQVGTIDKNGHLWMSERIAWDGIKDISCHGHILQGLSLDPTRSDDYWVPFSVDLQTRKIEGGSFRE